MGWNKKVYQFFVKTDKERKPPDLGGLFKIDPKKYSDAYTEHLIEQYKLYVQSHEKISERREGTNKFFLTLNTFLLGSISYLLDRHNDFYTQLLMGLGVGILISYFWYKIVRSYDNLNTGKFLVLHEVESRLPLALYDTEWNALGRGKDSSAYTPLTHIEKNVPVVFMFVFLILIAFVLTGEVIGLLRNFP